MRRHGSLAMTLPPKQRANAYNHLRAKKWQPPSVKTVLPGMSFVYLVGPHASMIAYILGSAARRPNRIWQAVRQAWVVGKLTNLAMCIDSLGETKQVKTHTLIVRLN